MELHGQLLSAGSSTPTVIAGSKVLWKGDYRGTSRSDYGQFSSTGKFNVSGNIMSLICEDDFVDKVDLTGSDHCFCYLFYLCSNLIGASDLILPATTLADYCYGNMFQNCTSLTTAPELPATALANGCYGQMFRDCSKPNYIKALFTTDPSSGSYTTNWVDGVSSTGTFVKNSAATWNVTGADGVPSGWTVETATA